MKHVIHITPHGVTEDDNRPVPNRVLSAGQARHGSPEMVEAHDMRMPRASSAMEISHDDMKAYFNTFIAELAKQQHCPHGLRNHHCRRKPRHQGRSRIARSASATRMQRGHFRSSSCSCASYPKFDIFTSAGTSAAARSKAAEYNIVM